MTPVGHDYLKIEVTKRQGFFGNCTADLAVTTYELVVPDTITTTAPVTVRIDGHEFTLARRDS